MGTLKRIHVNRHRLRDGLPCLGVEESGRRKRYRSTLQIDGPSVMIYRPDRPLACGAKAWIETRARVR